MRVGGEVWCLLEPRAGTSEASSPEIEGLGETCLSSRAKAPWGTWAGWFTPPGQGKVQALDFCKRSIEKSPISADSGCPTGNPCLPELGQNFPYLFVPGVAKEPRCSSYSSEKRDLSTSPFAASLKGRRQCEQSSCTKRIGTSSWGKFNETNEI